MQDMYKLYIGMKAFKVAFIKQQSNKCIKCNKCHKEIKCRLAMHIKHSSNMENYGEHANWRKHQIGCHGKLKGPAYLASYKW